MRETIKTLGFTLAAFVRPRLGRGHIRRYRLKKLKKLVSHAARHSPFYRDWFRTHGFDPADLKSLDDLRKIPPIGKQHLRALHQAFSSGEITRKRLIEHKTSGSTGVPVQILRSPAEERRLNMLRWRLQWMLGLRPGYRLAKVKTTWEPLSRRFNRLQDLARKIGLLETRVFDCFLPPEENYRELLAYQPHVLSGYPGALARIARVHDQQGGSFRNLRRVSCGGEAMAPHQRRILENSFGVPVHDSYGTSECNLAAWLCLETGQYHVNDDGILLEICRDGVPVAEGEVGEVVITSLHSRVMPIIRYRLGDLATAGPDTCPCGSPFSTFSDLHGRIIDYLQLADGRELHPFEFMNEVVIAATDWLVEYQVVQQEPGELRLLIVPRHPVSTKETARLQALLQDSLDNRIRVHVELTDHIPLTEGGKFHFCRSEIQAIPQRR